MKSPSLGINPQLTQTYDRDRWINEGFEKNGSESARESKKSILSRLDHYCNKIHSMAPEEIFLWMKKESKKTSEPHDTLTQYAIDFLSRYVKFCQKDHKDILIRRGRNPAKTKLNKKNFLHKLHNNSITLRNLAVLLKRESRSVKDDVVILEKSEYVKAPYIAELNDRMVNLTPKSMRVMEKIPQPKMYDEFIERFDNPEKVFGDPIKYSNKESKLKRGFRIFDKGVIKIGIYLGVGITLISLITMMLGII